MIQANFRTFGGGQASYNNPMAAAFKDKPLMFAASVDVKEVVEAILKESGHADLLAALDQIANRKFLVDDEVCEAIDERDQMINVAKQAIAKGKEK